MVKRFIFCAFICFYLFSCNSKKEYFFLIALNNNEIDKEVLTPEILWKFGRITEFEISPDGKFVAYIVKRYSLEKNKGNSEIFISSSDGKDTRQITFTTYSESVIHWHPNGQKIGFLSSKNGTSQIWEIDLKGKNLRQISSLSGNIDNFMYSPTGENILFTMRVKTDTSAQDKYPDLPLSTGRVYTDLMYRHWDSWWDYCYSHIFVAKIKNNKLYDIKDINESEPYDTPLAPYFESTDITWSPDGSKIAYVSKKLKGKEASLSTNSDVYLFDLKTNTTRNLTEGMLGYDRYPVFSHNGKMICWSSMQTPGYESDKERLMLYDFQTNKLTYLTSDFDQNASSMVWSEDDKCIYFISGINATYQIYKIDINNKKIVQLTRGWHDYTSIFRSGGVMIGSKMSFSLATELFNVDENGKEKQITFVNQNIYSAIEMGKVCERWITTTDKKKMLVWLILPPNFDSTKKYPAILYCQGGPQSAVSQFFSYRWNLQLMAANGYIVIAPNRRGLPTFGQEWNDQIALDYGGQNIKDYLTAVDTIKKEPYIDENRIGAVGASYGGYSVYYLAGCHNKRFKAFIAHCGMFNFESEFASTDEYFFEYHDIGGPYWLKPKPKGYNFSPHLFVDKWDTPIMIITGENDFRIPYTESLQAFNVAQLRNIPSKLLVFPDESHWVLKPQNSILWQREFFDWLDKWLKK